MRRRYVIVIAALMAAVAAATILLAPGGGTSARPADSTTRPTTVLPGAASSGYCIEDSEDGQVWHDTLDGTAGNDGLHIHKGPCSAFRAP